MKVAGHLQEKKGYYYAVLSYQEATGKQKTKWISTKLPVKGNKKNAEAFLAEAKKNFVIPSETDNGNTAEPKDMLFTDFLLYWIDVTKPNVRLNTYAGYSASIRSTINPYFKKKGDIPLKDVQPKDIQDFYTEQLKRVKPNSVVRYHAVIRKALCYAHKMDMIAVNPIYKVEKPKKIPFVGSFYDSEELSRLFEAVQGTNMEIIVLLGGFYGLRRSEAVGLRWKSVNFESNTITVNHTITMPYLDGKRTLLAEDRTKNKSSMRTLPLVPPIKAKLLELKARQEINRRNFKRSYNTDYLDYICVNEMGNLLTPDYVTAAFRAILENNGFRKIRYHDLRHTCASLMLANGVSMKQIQEWLGHSDFSTTANINSHLDYNAKILSADCMMNAVVIPGNPRSKIAV